MEHTLITEHDAGSLATKAAGFVAGRLVAVTGPYQGHWRMTLTYPALALADETLWLVEGPGKHEALGRRR